MLLTGVLGLLVAASLSTACGNISLSNATQFQSSGSPAAASGNGGDAGPPVVALPGEGGASSLPATAVDAGVAPASSGNPLCLWTIADAGSHTCAPDTSNQCAPASVDSGIYDPSDDAGDAGAPKSACHVVPNGQACTTGGLGGDGAECQVSTDCADSFECVGSPGQCRHYCCGGNASCDSASNQTTGVTFCDVQTTTAGGLNVPVCEPVASCTPLLQGTGAGTCPKGYTCGVVKDDGTTSCVPIGTVGIGGNCDVFHCAAELTCLGAAGSRTCFQLCEVDTPQACPYGTTCTSSAQLFSNANLGICQ